MSDRTEQIVVAVAPLLTGAWRYNKKASDFDGWQPRLTISDDRAPGRVLLVRPYSKYGDQRLEIYGLLPKWDYGSFATDHITVSEKRTPLSIAHDINRRLLPDFLKQWEKQKAQATKYALERIEHMQKIELVRPIVQRLRGQYGRKITANETQFTFDGGSLVMHSGSRIEPELKLRLTYDEVLQVLHFVKQMKERN